MRKFLLPFLNILATGFVVLISSCKSNEQQKVDNDITVHIASTREYYVPYNGKIDFEPISNSLIEKRFDISLSIINNSDQRISIWLMKCSWENNFIINNPYIFLIGTNCDSNYPIIKDIKSHDSIVFNGTLSRELKFDNSCKNCDETEHTDVATTKIGLIEIDTFKCKTLEEYLSTIEDKSKWDKIIWSNSLSLNKK